LLLLTVMTEKEGEACLSTFFVEAAYRGRGIGRALLERAVTEARLQGCHSLLLETRSIFCEAIHLYESTGWKQLPAHPSAYGFDRRYLRSLYSCQLSLV
jgi:putative acetyltransferase